MNQFNPVEARDAWLLGRVGIRAIETALPPFSMTQDEAMQRARARAPGFAGMAGVFVNSGIERRYSSVPLEWYDTPRGWRESNATFVGNALALLEEVAVAALASAGLDAADIGATVLVTSSGLAIPSLESMLANRLGFSPRMQRTPVFGLGCAGGTTGLSRATQIARAMPGANVLLLVVELGGLNVEFNPESAAMFVSTALFGDGAAALILRSDAAPRDVAPSLAEVGPSGEHMWRDTGYVMGWEVMDNGLDVVLSGTLPRFTRENLKQAVDGFLETHSLGLADIDGYVVHPGGPKVLEAVEQALDIEPSALRHSREVLRRFGNMSSPTVLFVLRETVAAGQRGRHLMMSFGPGFTASFAIVDI